jgi:hypothetical protein
MRPPEPIGEQATPSQGVYKRLARYPLLNTLIERRSRRFGDGMSLNGGPLAYYSTHAPQPLSLEEEAALAFAGCGITGFALADLPYESGDVSEAGGDNIMTRFVGRTVASGDAAGPEEDPQPRSILRRGQYARRCYLFFAREAVLWGTKCLRTQKNHWPLPENAALGARKGGTACKTEELGQQHRSDGPASMRRCTTMLSSAP